MQALWDGFCNLVLAHPRQTFAVVAACLLPAAFLWRMEYSLPEELNHWLFRVVLLIGSIILGPLACFLIWQSMDAVVPGLIGGLCSEGFRQGVLWYLSKKYPGLTARPRLQIAPGVELKQMENGDLGVKRGVDATVALTPEQKAAILGSDSDKH